MCLIQGFKGIKRLRGKETFILHLSLTTRFPSWRRTLLLLSGPKDILKWWCSVLKMLFSWWLLLVLEFATPILEKGYSFSSKTWNRTMFFKKECLPADLLAAKIIVLPMLFYLTVKKVCVNKYEYQKISTYPRKGRVLICTVDSQYIYRYSVIKTQTSASHMEKSQLVLAMQWKKVKSLSRVRLFVTPWTVAYQASPSLGFSTQEYWNGLPFPSPGDLPDPGIEPRVSHIAGRCFTLWATREAMQWRMPS